MRSGDTGPDLDLDPRQRRAGLYRTALLDNHGYVSPATMNLVEEALREFLELP